MADEEGAAVVDAEDAYDDALILEDEEACEGAGVATVTNGERDNVRYLGPALFLRWRARC